MNRLIKSSKFWLAIIGSIFSILSFVLTNEINLSYWILTAFIGGIIGNTAEDLMDSFKSVPGGGLPPPKDDEDEEENETP